MGNNSGRLTAEVRGTVCCTKKTTRLWITSAKCDNEVVTGMFDTVQQVLLLKLAKMPKRKDSDRRLVPCLLNINPLAELTHRLSDRLTHNEITTLHPNLERSKRCRIDFTEGFDLDGPDLLRTPSHTTPISMPDPEAIQTAFALHERSDTPFQPQPPGRSKMKGKRKADPTLQE
ncbi:unnamed protein product [Mytilus coruscus]|uniref:Uncharacterized protein n=1 Tax=Mytilus coruscus TaxID=42192 RepID=A0A6J8A156_MYTCO|nr:unnamed protein product [Mytilus coruscus]